MHDAPELIRETLGKLRGKGAGGSYFANGSFPDVYCGEGITISEELKKGCIARPGRPNGPTASDYHMKTNRTCGCVPRWKRAPGGAYYRQIKVSERSERALRKTRVRALTTTKTNLPF